MQDADIWTMVHESAHFMGLSDRYSDVKEEKKSVPNPGYSNDVMGKYGKEQVSQQHYDNLGSKILTEYESTGKTSFPLEYTVDKHKEKSKVKAGKFDDYKKGSK